MKKTTIYLLAVMAFVFLAGLGGAQTPADGQVDKLLFVPYKDISDVLEKDGKKIFLPFDEWERLTQAADGKEPEGPEFVIQSMSLFGHFERNLLVFDAEFVVQSFRDRIVEVPLLYRDISLKEMTLVGESEEESLPVVLKDDVYMGLIQKKGVARIHARFVPAMRFDGGMNRVDFRIPRVAIVAFEGAFPWPEVQVQIENAKGFQTLQQPMEGPDGKPITGTMVLADLGGIDQVGFSWRVRPTGKPAPTRMEMLASGYVGDRTLYTNMTLRYNFNVAEVTETLVHIPKDSIVTNVQGERVQGWTLNRIEGEQSVREVRIALNPDANSEEAGIVLSLSTPLNEEEWLLPTFHFPGVEDFVGYWGVRTEPNRDLEVVEIQNAQKITAGELPGEMQQLQPGVSLRTRSMDYMVKIRTRTIDPEFRTQQQILVSIGDTVVQLTDTIEFNIYKGALGAADIVLPATDCVVTNVTAMQGNSNALNGWSVEEATGQSVLKVQFSRLVVGQIVVKMERSRPYTDKVEMPEFVVTGAERDNGFIAIQPMTSIEVEVVETSQVKPLDVTELPDSLVPRTGKPILYAYRFMAHPYGGMMKVRHHKDVQVLMALAETGFARTVITTEGRMMTELVLDVKNTQRQYLKIGLDEKAEVWSALVADEPVKVARDADGNVLLPLVRSAGEGEQRETFRVKITYVLDSPKLRSFGKVQAELPSIDIPINELHWQTYYPQKYGLGQVDTNMIETRPHGATRGYMSMGSEVMSEDMGYAGGRAAGVQVQQKKIHGGAVSNRLGRALESYFVDNNAYPTDFSQLQMGVDYIGKDVDTRKMKEEFYGNFGLAEPSVPASPSGGVWDERQAETHVVKALDVAFRGEGKLISLEQRLIVPGKESHISRRELCLTERSRML